MNRWEKKKSTEDPLLPIPSEDIHKFVGKKVHLKWAPAGCVWILTKIVGETMHLQTPKTGKKLLSHISSACYLRAYEPGGRI